MESSKQGKKWVVAIDQGTTSCRAVVFGTDGKAKATVQREFTQRFPKAGWVEHDAAEIWQVQLAVMLEAVKDLAPESIAGVGITNQRETIVIWDRTTGQPLHPAIVWQCRRTTKLCEEMKANGDEQWIREKTGLVIDPYFSATKLKWVLDEYPEIRQRAERGEVLFGTIDSWLLWNLTAGRVHATDYTNASRTMLFNLHTLTWDEELLQFFDVPAAMLPEVRPSSYLFGETTFIGDRAIPVCGIAGDQQAALFGQACFSAGLAKNTYGTGCFLLMNTGEKPVFSQKGLLTTVAWGIDGNVEYALEGSVFTAGAVIQWLRDGLGLITHASETAAWAKSVVSTEGVYFVPAFTGLGTPYWNPHARGMISGITRGTTKAHMIRAALESIAYQSVDVLRVMEEEAGTPLAALRVDGGATVNEFLMQFQADLLGIPVQRAAFHETTAQGAAYLAGLAAGVWDSVEDLQGLWQLDCEFEPQQDASYRKKMYEGWQRAVAFQS